MKKLTAVALIASSVALAGCGPQAQDPTQYDLVIKQGRVIDPASNTDKILNLGIKDGTIVSLSEGKLSGIKELDATGKVVSPGFIDLHTHSPFPFGARLQVKDGVTTALDLEAGAFPLDQYGAFFAEKGAPNNYGASVGHYAIRIKVIEGNDQPYAVTEYGAMVPGLAFTQQATHEQIEEMRKLLNEGVDQGGLGIGFLLDYMNSAVSEEELRMIFEVAKERNVPVWAHVRRGINGDIQPLLDVLDIAVELKAPLHISHINANAMGNIENWMKAIDDANAKGADVTMEVFPYTAGSTSISADVFSRDWQTIFGITYGDVQWAETGELFTKKSWEEKRKQRPDSMVIHHYMKEEWLRKALVHPEMIVATDAMPALNASVKSAPNGAGSYTRLLAKYVRDEGVISLMDAVAKGSYFPARRLEESAPIFAKKGRIQEGADADILVFDLEKLQSNAKYTDPYLESTGYDYVVVNGQVVIDHDKDTRARPGQHLFANKKQ